MIIDHTHVDETLATTRDGIKQLAEGAATGQQATTQ